VFVLRLSCNSVITYCFYRMLQTDMQLLSIYLVSELHVAAVLKFHCYHLGCYAQLRRDVFCAFLQHCFLSINGERLSALHCVISDPWSLCMYLCCK